VRQWQRRAALGQAAWLWALVLALLAAQSLGLAHRLLHGAPADDAGTSRPATLAAGPVYVALAAPLHRHADGERCDPRQAHADPWHDHEAGSAECRLVDQLAHADLCSAAPVQPPLAPAGERWAMPGAAAEPPARGCAHYLARGPPPA
jgi:hypothetical protein